MIKKAIFIFLLVISIIGYMSLQKFNSSTKNKQTSFSDLKDRDRVKIILNSDEENHEDQKSITVEVVNTPQSTSQGLSGREEIGADGMLFIFPKIEARYFWMKDMSFDLDIVWIANNKVTQISRNVPKPAEDTPDYKLETYSPKEGVNMVLELYNGKAQELNINPGDVVQLIE